MIDFLDTKWAVLSPRSSHFVRKIHKVFQGHSYLPVSRDVTPFKLGDSVISPVSFQELLKDSLITDVYVCTTIDSHYEYCIELLNAKKNVLCEKSLVTNHTQLLSLKNAARANGVKLGMVFQPFYTADWNDIVKINSVGYALYKFENKFSRHDIIFEVGVYPAMVAAASILNNSDNRVPVVTMVDWYKGLIRVSTGKTIWFCSASDHLEYSNLVIDCEKGVVFDRPFSRTTLPIYEAVFQNFIYRSNSVECPAINLFQSSLYILDQWSRLT
jgi:hypothetical protein